MSDWRYRTLFFDLEVVSTITIEEARNRVDLTEPEPGKVPSNWKDPVKVAAKQAEIDAKHAQALAEHSAKIEQEAKKIRSSGALSWNESQICLISWAVDDGPVMTLSCDDSGWEASNIDTFANYISQAKPDIITAFNGSNYDFPMMRYRALAHGLGWVADLFTDVHFGVARQLQYYRNGPVLVDPRAHGLTPGRYGLKGSGSLDSMADFFGIDRSANPGKGSEVQTWYDSGEHASIVAHGEDDIRVFREVWKRVTPWETGE